MVDRAGTSEPRCIKKMTKRYADEKSCLKSLSVARIDDGPFNKNCLFTEYKILVSNWAVFSNSRILEFYADCK